MALPEIVGSATGKALLRAMSGKHQFLSGAWMADAKARKTVWRLRMSKVAIRQA
jgi:hypothetical protein